MDRSRFCNRRMAAVVGAAVVVATGPACAVQAGSLLNSDPQAPISRI